MRIVIRALGVLAVAAVVAAGIVLPGDDDMPTTSGAASVAVTASSVAAPRDAGPAIAGSGPRLVNEPEVVPFLMETAGGSIELTRPVDPDAVPDPFEEGQTPPPGYRHLLPRDGIAPVYEPAFVTPEQVEWRGDDLVLGLEIDGDARAYPIGYLTSREMVIDRVAGVPVLASW